MKFLRAFGLSVLLFPVGLATHEVMHLAVFSAMGVPVSLLVTSWHLGTSGTPIFGLHAAPTGPLSLSGLVTNNGLGPALAALLLFVLWLAVDRTRSRAASTALLANIFALVFFSLIEMAYPLLEGVAHVDADVLLLPELNYGLVLLIMAITALVATAPGGGRRSPAVRPPSAERLPAP